MPVAPKMTLFFFYVALALGFSFLCSILEAALLSITPSYVAQLEEEQPASGKKLRELKDDVDRPLAAILSLNTVANTLGAAGAGAEAAMLFGPFAFVATAALVFSILVFSEIIPKTLGAVFWKRFVPLVIRVVPLLIAMLYPLVLLSDAITRALKNNAQTETRVSRDEIAALAGLAEAEGAIAPTEARILRSLVHCGELVVDDVMTPRTVMFTLEADAALSTVLDRPQTKNFSRIPVTRGSLDTVVGYVLKSEILQSIARGEGERLVSEFVREHLVVPSTLGIAEAFQRLLDSREHIAIVLDEHGGVDGVVTMEDVIETLLGLEIVDEADAVLDMREMARTKWRARARRLDTMRPVHAGEGWPQNEVKLPRPSSPGVVVTPPEERDDLTPLKPI